MSTQTRGADAPSAQGEFRIPEGLEAEFWVLGSLLQWESALQYLEHLKEPDFILPQHGPIFKAVRDLCATGKKVDAVSVRDELARTGKLGQVGGLDYLMALVGCSPGPAFMSTHVESVRLKSRFRKLRIVCAETVAALDSKEALSMEELGSLGNRVLDSVSEDQTDGKIQPISEVAKGFQINRRSRIEDPEYLRSDLIEIDRGIDLFASERLTIIAGRPRMGKTTFMRHLILANQDRGPQLVVTLEESERELVDKMICTTAKVSYQRYCDGYLDEDERGRLLLAQEQVSRIDCDIYDGTADAVRIILLARRQVALGRKPKVIYIDHCHRMKHPQAPGESLAQAMGKSSWAMKTMAKELKVPVLLFAQLNREPEKRQGKPMLADLRDSGQLEQDADNVLFIWTDKDLNGGVRTVSCEKQRGGATFETELAFLGDLGAFGNLHTPARPA